MSQPTIYSLIISGAERIIKCTVRSLFLKELQVSSPADDTDLSINQVSVKELNHSGPQSEAQLSVENQTWTFRNSRVPYWETGV